MPCYDQSCTAANLVNIPPLVLSDTFNTWFDRTNQLIDVVSAINLFDIGVGPTDSGLRLERGCTNGFYSGVAVLYVSPGAGIGIGTEAFTNNYNKVVVDATRLQDIVAGNTATNPEIDDYFIISDKSDTRQSPYGTPKRVTASRMLPNTVYFGETGSGTFTIQGNLNVIGNVSIQGTESFIDSNDLRIEDKVIELGYGRYAELVVLGSGLTSGSFAAGMTAYYVDEDGLGGDDDPVPTENPTTIGRVFSWAIGETGVSGTIRISSFTLGGVDDFADTGNLVVTGGGYEGVLNVTGPIGIGDYFLTDDLLQPAGIIIKGAESDKTFLWMCNAPQGAENWNAFVSNKNLGVSGSGNWILSSKFASYGYSDSTVDNTFTYLGAGDSYTKYSVGNELIMEHSPTGDSVGTTFGIVYMGSTGPNVLPGVPVYDWVKYFNADQLDGAHASTASVPWTIPILGADGRLGGDLVSADAIRKRFTVSGHAFSKGDVVRIDVGGSLTFASASTIPTAEAIGMVETVEGNDIMVVTKGFIYGLNTGTRLNAILPLATGNVYFLSPTTPGGLIDSADAGIGIDTNEVRKAMFLAAGSNSGYVLNYTGVVLGEPTDTVYTSTFAPIGSIHTYAGPSNKIPLNWMLCDGRRLEVNPYSELYDVISQSYYAEATKAEQFSALTIANDTRGLQVNDNVRVTWFDGANNQTMDAVVESVNTTTRTVTLTVPSVPAFNTLQTGTALRVYGNVAPTGTSIFFLPDFRSRAAIGASLGVATPTIPLGGMGGSDQINFGTAVSPGSGAFASATENRDTLPPYVGINWIIRVRKSADATILTGHNHDLRYIRYDGEHTISGGAANDLSLVQREQFRDNARAMSDGRDGPDTFHDSLTIDGSISVSGSMSVSGVAQIWSGIGVSGDARFGLFEPPFWNINDGAGSFMKRGPVRSYSFYSGLTGSIVFLQPPLSNFASPNTLNKVTLLTRCGLTGTTQVEIVPPPDTIGDGVGPEFNISPIRFHSYDMFDASKDEGVYAHTSRSVPLTIQTDSGQLGCVPMYRVIPRMPTASEIMRLPQGFVWVNSATGQAAGLSSGSWIKSGLNLHRMGSISTDSGVPIGTIVIWSGLLTAIPNGWALCNGGTHPDGNGNFITTPNLTNRFVVGAGVTYNRGDVGGANSVTLTVEQMPAHTHTIRFGDAGSAGEINNDGMTMYPSVTTTTSSVGGGQPHENRPPYYALAYIMKIKGGPQEPEIPANPSPLPCDPCASRNIVSNTKSSSVASVNVPGLGTVPVAGSTGFITNQSDKFVSVTITPRKTESKMLVRCSGFVLRDDNISGGTQYFYATVSNGTSNIRINNADADVHMVWTTAPSTSQNPTIPGHPVIEGFDTTTFVTAGQPITYTFRLYSSPSSARVSNMQITVEEV